MESNLPESVLKKAVSVALSVPLEDVTIKNVEAKAAVKEGDNFSCILKKVKIECNVVKGGKEQVETLRCIAKCLPDDEFRQKTIRESASFDKEVPLYTEVLPALQRYDPKLCVPRGYAGDIDVGIVVMEDMTVSGFEMLSQSAGLERRQLEMALDQLARIHASSYHFIQTATEQTFKQNYPAFFHDGWVVNQKVNYIFLLMAIESAEAVVKEFCDPEMAKVMTQFCAQIEHHSSSMFKQKTDGRFQCLCHMDTWCNNFMFKNKTEQICLLDFEVFRYGSPTLDLAYFFGSCTTPEFREENIEDLLKFYHQILMQQLQGFQYKSDVYTFEALKSDFNENFLFGSLLGCTHAQLQLSDFKEPNVFFDPSTLTADDEKLDKMLDDLRSGQFKHAKENEALRKRMIALANEMRKYKYF